MSDHSQLLDGHALLASNLSHKMSDVCAVMQDTLISLLQVKRMRLLHAGASAGMRVACSTALACEHVI